MIRGHSAAGASIEVTLRSLALWDDSIYGSLILGNSLRFE
jgi:hypothetical protein